MKPNNLVEMLHRTVERFPDKNVFMWKEKGTYQHMTYVEFWEKIFCAASGLAQLGIGMGDKVAIISNSNPMWGTTDFAAASIGAVSVPVYPTLPADQVAYTLKNGDVRVAVVEDKEQYEKVKAGDAELEAIVMMYPGESQERAEENFSFSELEAMGKEHPLEDWEDTWRAFGRDQLATIIHTSGTTGNPKGVMLTHGNFLSNVEAVQFWLIELLPDDLTLSYLPLSHVFERMAGHYMPLSVGTTIAYAESINTIQENLVEVRPTVLTSVPRLFEKVYAMVWDEINQGTAIKQKIFKWAVSVGEERYEHYLNARTDEMIKQTAMPKDLFRKWKWADRLVFQKVKEKLGGRLRGMVSGGGTLNPELARFFWAIDLPLLEGYGLTETSPVVTTNPMTHAKAGTVGRVLPNLDVKTADDGEVLVRGPSIMKGYYKNPEATEKDFDGDWFKTGDIGRLDEEGYLKIIDRKKRLLVLSTGKNVAPQPIENAISESMYISNAVIFGEKQKYVICLVNPDFENLIPWAKRQGIETDSTEEICRYHHVKELIERRVEQHSEGVASFEKPKKVVIAGKEWTVDDGELTPKLSLRLNVIKEKYRELIEETYGEDFVDDRKETVTAGDG
ncbi:long-chain fatty acid--CoA ligase [Lentibacillus sp. CBA3610]|uniref:AMP-dependent synthetase/ligase n=1 Tax=Lentibacillus sp. CBA3610 TaxID=2518176 RepID=UPI0015962165|nr:long-chain fatty acid--CoA ligase [Lentibacillus sp. CBA3610]QKY68754.1 long-chain fatty acid--CoA ligase [Lentibacillus sp. CBA3610]